MIYSFYIMLSVLMQFNYPESFRYKGMAPDFLLVLPVLIAYLFGAYDGIAVGIVAGMMKDVYAGRVLGLGALLCLYCALIASVFLKNHLSSGVFPALFQTAFGSVIYFTVIFFITYMLYGQSYPFVEYLEFQALNKMLPGVLLNTLSGLLFFYLFRLIPPFKRKKHSLDIDYI
ncbi:MAG: rod shape-determining protein MreD, partial [Saccharofermentanales bacterium]